MRKFLGEFKKFITRGNVIDMAVGVIIGGAFSAIVTALTNQILMPLINWFLAVVTKGEGMGDVVTMLKPVEVDGVLDMTQSIYIDWGAFITAIINFLLIAIVLFLIIRAINHLHDNVNKQKSRFAPLTKEDVQAFRREGKTTDEILKIAAAKKAADEEAARIAAEEAAANAPKTEQQLLSEIVELLKEKK